MSKQKSTLIRDALALFLITLISGLALSYIYEVTKAPIVQQQESKKQKANQAVFMDATTFEADEELLELANSTDLSTLNSEYAGITIDEVNKALNSNGELLGYNLTVTTKQSYDDSMTFVFSYSMEGKINGISYTSISETAGLGMKAKDAKFTDQYLNKEVKEFVVTKTGATSDEQIDALSGATVTSKAVTNAVNAGISFLTENVTELGGGANE